MDQEIPVPAAPEATKLHYIGGKPTSITLRRIQLIVQRDGVETGRHTFDKETVTIGAVEDNDLVLDDETVSRNHCRIWLEGGNYMISDLHSTNGTFVNRIRIREAFLRPDVTIALGKSEITFAPVDEQVQIVPSKKDRFGDIIGSHPKLRELYAILEKIAPTDATVIIEGETGTGKEVVSRTIHMESRRRDGPFMVFDCSAVPENLIESELFGHEKGAFTGAINTRQGVFELADGGTVFLDELGELQLELQPRLLRVLEQREVKRVGGSKPTKVNVRVIAATNRDLEKEVRAGRFREDLFYRLSVVRVSLPPLRDRPEDLPLLIKHFLKIGQFNRLPDGGRKVTQLAREAMDLLGNYQWPGNVRELHNVIERAVSFADGEIIQLRDLPDQIILLRGRPRSDSTAINAPAVAGKPVVGMTSVVSPPVGGPVPPVDGTFKDAKEKWIASFERDYIANLLRKNNMNISHAAREAEIDRKYFRKLMKKYGLSAHGEAEVEEEDDDVE